MNDFAHLERIERGLQRCGLPMMPAPLLLSYLKLLHRWNQTHNLTAVRELSEMIPRHLFDSLAIYGHLQGTTWIDVGSGAGLPGIPLAIVQPEWQFTLLDASQKRVRFMQQVVLELKLRNVKVVHGRMEQYNEAVESGICRAFSHLADFFAMTHPHVERLYAMKGQYPEEELYALQSLLEPLGTWRVTCERVEVPELEAQRHLVKVSCQ